MKRPVSLRALEQRINRKLSKDYKRLCRSRRGGQFNNLGKYHILNTYTNTVIDFRITDEGLESLARELRVMADWEELADQ